MHSPEGSDDLAAVQEVWQKGELDLRVNMMVPEERLEDAVRLGADAIAGGAADVGEAGGGKLDESEPRRHAQTDFFCQHGGFIV